MDRRTMKRKRGCMVSDHIQEALSKIESVVLDRGVSHGGWKKTNELLYPILDEMYRYQEEYLIQTRDAQYEYDYDKPPRLHYQAHHVWRGVQWVGEKIARMQSGDSDTNADNRAENWMDICGYAILVLEEIKRVGKMKMPKKAREAMDEVHVKTLLGADPDHYSPWIIFNEAFIENCTDKMEVYQDPARSSMSLVRVLMHENLYVVHDHKLLVRSWEFLRDIAAEEYWICINRRGAKS